MDEPRGAGWLTLCRRQGERVTIELEDGRTIQVEFVGVWDLHKARIAFNAPKTVKIYRNELAGKFKKSVDQEPPAA
jgi:sRNA-binding carbon storage regulator CsrA